MKEIIGGYYKQIQSKLDKNRIFAIITGKKGALCLKKEKKEIILL